MITFQERLAKRKENEEKNMAPQFLKIMHDATRSLENSGIENGVMKPGATFPNFSLLNMNNKLIDLQGLLNNGALVISFYRGFWCPFCNIDLANLNHYLTKIEILGARLIAISPEKPEYSKKIIAMQKLKFDILWDQGNNLADSLGLKFTLPDKLKSLYRDSFNTNLKLYHGDDDWALPMPARFIVDRSNTIRYAESSPDYTKRPDPDDLIEVLKNL
jgi:peroxiredoxin